LNLVESRLNLAANYAAASVIDYRSAQHDVLCCVLPLIHVTAVSSGSAVHVSGRAWLQPAAAESSL